MTELTVTSYGNDRHNFIYEDMDELREHVEKCNCPITSEYELELDGETITTTNYIGDILAAVEEIENFLALNGDTPAAVVQAVYENQHGNIRGIEVSYLELPENAYPSDAYRLGLACVDDGLYEVLDSTYFDYEALGRDLMASGEWYVSGDYAINEL